MSEANERGFSPPIIDWCISFAMHLDPPNMSKDLDPFYVSKIYKHIICSEVNDMFKGYPCMEAMLAPTKPWIDEM